MPLTNYGYDDITINDYWDTGSSTTDATHSPFINISYLTEELEKAFLRLSDSLNQRNDEEFDETDELNEFLEEFRVADSK